MIVPCTAVEQSEWLRLRRALWPDGSAEEHLLEMASLIDDPRRYAQFIAATPAGEAVGLVEAALRTDYVNGTSSSPVAFIEGIYVVPAHRRMGIGAALVKAVTDWARDAGCSELASDAALDNVGSHAMHRALGFEETERVVFFRKPLDA
jgi:aminoglycoside 6'-N-acetyltransferase I